MHENIAEEHIEEVGIVKKHGNKTRQCYKSGSKGRLPCRGQRCASANTNIDILQYKVTKKPVSIFLKSPLPNGNIECSAVVKKLTIERNDERLCIHGLHFLPFCNTRVKSILTIYNGYRN